jgi:hypothetical protein
MLVLGREKRKDSQHYYQKVVVAHIGLVAEDKQKEKSQLDVRVWIVQKLKLEK